MADRNSSFVASADIHRSENGEGRGFESQAEESRVRNGLNGSPTPDVGNGEIEDSIMSQSHLTRGNDIMSL